MASIVDNRGFNQGFAPSPTLAIRTERRIQAMLAEMDLRAPRAILELGCGTGEMSDLLAARTTAAVVGTDLCAPFIQAAASRYQRPNLSFAVMDLTAPELPKGIGRTFDYIVGNGILHHLHDDLPILLPRLRNLLAPGGRLIFWEPNLCNPYVFLIFKIPCLRRWARLEPAEMAFSKQELTGLFRAARFNDLNIGCRDFLVPNLPLCLVKPVVFIGDWVEKLPLLSQLAQSVFVSAGT